MGKTRKWLHYIPDRISDGMRCVCGRLSPDVRLIVVVAMLVGFSALSIYITVSSIYNYITVSSIYNIGKRRGEQMRIERMRQLELHPGISKDSIHFNHDKKHGREQNGKTAGNGKEE